MRNLGHDESRIRSGLIKKQTNKAQEVSLSQLLITHLKTRRKITRQRMVGWHR